MNTRQTTATLSLGLALLLALGGAAQAADKTMSAKQAQLDRGRYLVLVGGCNDCHTVGYAESGGQTPQAQWLRGSPVGFQGPWGTTYPTNLRLSAQAMGEGEWLVHARSPMRPPMPSPSLKAMTDRDLKAVYHFIRSLGGGGEPVPAYVPPSQPVSTPYIDFVPRNLTAQGTAPKS